MFDQTNVLRIQATVGTFTVPAVLKSWIDLLVRCDVAFISTENGKIALLRDRPTIIAVTSGGAMFRDPPRLGVGITDLQGPRGNFRIPCRSIRSDVESALANGWNRAVTSPRAAVNTNSAD